LNVSTLSGFRHIPSTCGGGTKCIISKPISVAAPAATGGNKICFFPSFFLGLSSFTLRFGIGGFSIKKNLDVIIAFQLAYQQLCGFDYHHRYGRISQANTTDYPIISAISLYLPCMHAWQIKV
jgi:hypothetical protein